MTTQGWTFAALALVLSSAGCADMPAGGGGREVSVEADGWSPITEGSLLTARHRALAEAQKKAVEKVVGVTLKAHTRVDNAINVKESIEANMGGTIRRYEVLKEGAEGDLFKVRIRAVVLWRQPLDGKPGRRVVRFAVKIPSEKVVSSLRSTLAAWDFVLSDDGQAADVMVTGMVETHGLADPRLGGFFSYRAKVSLNVSDLRTGTVTQQNYEATAVDSDDRAACDAALEKAGEGSGQAIAALFAAAPTTASAPPLLLGQDP